VEKLDQLVQEVLKAILAEMVSQVLKGLLEQKENKVLKDYLVLEVQLVSEDSMVLMESKDQAVLKVNQALWVSLDQWVTRVPREM
jgi:hypothetical protein